MSIDKGDDWRKLPMSEKKRVEYEWALHLLNGDPTTHDADQQLATRVYQTVNDLVNDRLAELQDSSQASTDLDARFESWRERARLIEVQTAMQSIRAGRKHPVMRLGNAMAAGSGRGKNNTKLPPMSDHRARCLIAAFALVMARDLNVEKPDILATIRQAYGILGLTCPSDRTIERFMEPPEKGVADDVDWFQFYQAMKDVLPKSSRDECVVFFLLDWATGHSLEATERFIGWARTMPQQ